MLGDDALSCLRDIKRWLKLYDEKFNRMDVARCLGEANLVNGDLIQILALGWSDGQQSKYLSRISLACSEWFALSFTRENVVYLTDCSRIASAFDLAVRDPWRNDNQPPSSHTIPTASPGVLQTWYSQIRELRTPTSCHSNRPA